MSETGSTEVVARPSVTETVKSLTGFDEIAIEQAFRTPLQDVMEGARSVRALIFVMKRREGLSDHDAFLAAMNVARGDVDSFFSTSEEVDEGKAPEPNEIETGLSS